MHIAQIAIKNDQARHRNHHAAPLKDDPAPAFPAPWLRQALRSVLLSLAACACCASFTSVAAYADCSRPIVTPMSPTGTGVIIEKDKISGVYVDVLRSVGKKEGCSFVFSAVPRARQEALFQAGQSDVLVPATRSPSRDEAGIFVPLISVRPTLISLESARPAIHSLQEVLERRELKLALLRGYNYGDNYQALIKELGKQGRLILEADTISIARLIMAGTADATIMTSLVFAGAVQMDSRVLEMQNKLRYEVLDDLPWIDSGAYISRTALNARDREALRELFEYVVKSGVFWSAVRRSNQPEALKDSVRPRASSPTGPE